jgi:spore germination protein GerM
VRKGAVVVLALAALAMLSAGACKKKTLTTNLNRENKVVVRTVTLYFEAPDMLLAAESRNVALPENHAGAMSAVVRELFKGSANTSIPRIFPSDTIVRGAYLLPDGTAFVDLGGATLTSGWGTGTHEELMAAYSVVQTVAVNFPETKRVRILINGTPAETLAGHINIGRALTPNASYVGPARAGA